MKKSIMPGISIPLEDISIGDVWRVVDNGSTKTCFYVMEITSTNNIWGVKFSPNINGFSYCTIEQDCFLIREGFLLDDEPNQVEIMQSAINDIFLRITDFYFLEDKEKDK